TASGRAASSVSARRASSSSSPPRSPLPFGSRSGIGQIVSDPVSTYAGIPGRRRHALLVAGAAGAAAPEDDVVLGDLEGDLALDAVDRGLEGRVLEGLHAPADPADRVMVMVAAGIDPLVAGDPPRQVGEALDEAELLELLERPVDTGPPHRAA